jgi:hypothetical protein
VGALLDALGGSVRPAAADERVGVGDPLCDAAQPGFVIARVACGDADLTAVQIRARHLRAAILDASLMDLDARKGSV